MMKTIATALLLINAVHGASARFSVGQRNALIPPPKKVVSPAFVELPVPRGGAAASKADSVDDDALLSFLIVSDMIELNRDIARNWGFILQGGIVKVLAGLTALSVPIFANEVAYVTLMITTFVQGCFNAFGLFYEQKSFKIPSLVVGLAQIGLSYSMNERPVESLVGLTKAIAFTSVSEGLYQGAVALKNRDIPGWGSLLFSGLVSIAGGVFVAASMPEISLVALGVLMGSHLISGGLASISVALDGRETANIALG